MESDYGLFRRLDLIRFSASRASSSAFGTRSNPEVICRNREKVSAASSSVRMSGASSRSDVAMALVLHSVRRDQFFVGQAVSDGVRRDGKEPSAVRLLPRVVAEDLFVDVSVKMERGDGDVRAAQRPLEQAP